MRSPNIVPRGAIRLSEAFDRVCSNIAPDWSELPQLCVMWDENVEIAPLGDEGSGDNPYDREFEIAYRAETILRSALTTGALRAYIHNLRTGVDLELKPSEWGRAGETVGLPSDYTSELMPGPDCTLDGVASPIFIPREEFEKWLGRDPAALAFNAIAQSVAEPRAFSLEEVCLRTGLSRSKLYQEIEQKHLYARKCGNRTLVLESDLNAFLNALPNFQTGTTVSMP
ncbi:helix-turn-helix domain-containing protein [Bradyrhizobium monzae]|uniref:helix-turn-helix domain-containing protein n=1 Tax=Bradyrhizobium sp. Oc8 TaxID=2876780 RepID=UPI001F25DAC2|nr:helix-turn-helix domain-containing protein [Bradyrhizobium sp. Oc8]